MTRLQILLALCLLVVMALVAGCKKDDAAAATTSTTPPANATNERGGNDLQAGEMTPGPGAGTAESRVGSQAGQGTGG